MKDWQYDNLRQNQTRLEERIHKVENWQFFFPLRVMLVVLWLEVLGIWGVGIVHALQT